MNKKSKIYVAGHGGLVGQAILHELKEKGYKKVVLRSMRELDLRRQIDTEKFFSQERPEFVFLAAAKVGGILANSTYKAEFIYDNLMIAANVINSAFKFGVKKLLNLGSSCIYPRAAKQPIKEEYLLSGILEPTNEPYAIAKISALKLCRYYNEQYGTNFVSCMPTNLYGRKDNFNLETAHVIPSIMRKLHLGKLLKENNFKVIKQDILRYPLGYGLDKSINLDDKKLIKKILDKHFGVTKDKVVLWGSGKPLREFMYSQDLAAACIFLMERYDAKSLGGFVNIGSGIELEINELAQVIRKVVGFKGKIIWDKSKPDGMPRKRLDISRIKSLGWKSEFSLSKGLAMTYRWYQGHETNRYS
jgi:GDP-L-fucose synthase